MTFTTQIADCFYSLLLSALSQNTARMTHASLTIIVGNVESIILRTDLIRYFSVTKILPTNVILRVIIGDTIPFLDSYAARIHSIESAIFSFSILNWVQKLFVSYKLVFVS